MIYDTDIEDFLEHYGVKGMQWGVRTERPGPSRAQKKAGRKANRLEKRSGRRDLLTSVLRDENNKEAAQLRRIQTGKRTTDDMMRVIGQATIGDIATAAINRESVAKVFARNRMEGVKKNREIFRQMDAKSTAQRKEAAQLRRFANKTNG